jgi:hypothetical protein
MALPGIVVCHFLIIRQLHLNLILELDFTTEDLINIISLFSHELAIGWHLFDSIVYC